MASVRLEQEVEENASHRRTVTAWVMYDWANSAFATTSMAAVLPVFFSTVAAKGALTPVQASGTWALTQTIGMLLMAIGAPVLGAIADYSGSKKRFLAGFAIPGMLAAALMVFIGTGDWLLAAILYVVGEIGFSGSIIFYDSLLPHVAKPDEIDRVSTRGYAMGYLGGGLLLAINILMIQMPDALGITSLGARFGIGGTEMATRLALASVGLWWAIFSIPLFRRVPEPPRGRLEQEQVGNPIKGGFGRLIRTFREVRLYRQLLIFIIAFWIYNDGIGTIIKMATIYGAEIGIGQIDLIGALLLTQFVGIPFSLMFGRLPGSRRLQAGSVPRHDHLQRDYDPAHRHTRAPVRDHERPHRRRDSAGQPDSRFPAGAICPASTACPARGPDEHEERHPPGAGCLCYGVRLGLLHGGGD